jgi:hypothetical protein
MNSIAFCADSMPARVLKGIKSGAVSSPQTITAYVEPSLAQARTDDKFQFERYRDFVVDRVDHKVEKSGVQLDFGVAGDLGEVASTCQNEMNHRF